MQEAIISRTFNGTIADERRVLTVCLDELGIGERQVASALTCSGMRASDGERMQAQLHESLADLSKETLADFLAKNRERHPVDPALNPGGRLVCLSDEEFESIFGGVEDGWSRFREDFPESAGTVAFSRVGFNRDVTQAMMYASKQVEWLAGSGNIWLFSKLGETWAKKDLVLLWIS